MLISADITHLLPLLARLPSDRPFHVHEAEEAGVDSHARTELVRAGVLVRPVRGVYHLASLADTHELRVAVLKLVVPADCVVTDRTAAWVWGAEMVLAPGAHLEPPPVSVFAPPGRRLRNGLVASGERRLASYDVSEVDGLLVTTPLRTSCDLARLLPPAYALGTVDMVARLGHFSVDRLIEELDRFKGFRGIIQARVVAPKVDPRSQSIMEGVTRWSWYGAGLPRPECQVEIEAPLGSYFIDMGLPDEQFGAEYDGDEFHGPEQEEHDTGRREWARVVHSWSIVVARRVNVIGRSADIEAILRREWRRHRADRNQPPTRLF